MAQQGRQGVDVRRVAIVADWCAPRLGGIETHIIDLAANLRSVGLEATILTSFPGPAEIGGVRIDRVATPLLPGVALAFSPWLVGALRQRLSAGGFDLVHVHASQFAPFCLAATLAADRLGLPVVVTFHSLMHVLAPGMARAARWSGLPRHGVALTGVSSLVARQMASAMPGREVGVLANGYDAGFWMPAAEARPSSDGPVRLVSGMRLARRKRPFALLEVLARALEIAGAAGDGVTLTIAGAGPLRQALERRAGRLGIGSRVVFAGWLDRPGLRDLYRRSDLFLMPSVKESFCIAALEARATGLPVIGMACTGMTDFIRDGENGEMAADDADMAMRLAALLSDRGRLAALAADDDGLASFAWNGLAQEHLAFYGRVAAARSEST